MADRAVVAVFPTQSQAYDAAAELERLDSTGVIAVRRGAIVGKDDRGKLTAPDTKSRLGAPWGAVGGGLIGGAVGALLGPAGAAAGAAAGAGLGATADVLALGFGLDDVYAVGAGLDPGQTALIVEVGADATGAVAAAVQRHQGRVRHETLPERDSGPLPG
jgi:uncharacterized membrane protein